MKEHNRIKVLSLLSHGENFSKIKKSCRDLVCNFSRGTLQRAPTIFFSIDPLFFKRISIIIVAMLHRIYEDFPGMGPFSKEIKNISAEKQP